MKLTSAPTTRPDLLGKTIVDIHDPFPHGDGIVPPHATLGEVVVAEPDYTAVRELGSLQWMRGPDSFRPITQLLYDIDELEPGERLELYLPGASAVLGRPDFVHFTGRARTKWERERGTRSAPNAVAPRPAT